MEQQEPDLKVMAQFRKRLILQFAVSIPVALIGMGLIVLGGATAEDGNAMKTAAGPIGIGLIVAVLVFSLFNWRCPACKRYLGRRLPRYCVNCGTRLR